MTAPDLIALLSDILDDDHDAPPAAEAPAAPAEPLDPLPIAESPDAPVGEVVPIESARKRKAATGTRAGLVDEAVDTAHAALAVVRQAFDEGTADFDDAVKALPVAHKIIEHAERIEVARKTPGQWPIAHFVIDLTGAPQERPTIAARAVQPVPAAIEIDAEPGDTE
jgi:hypothetical protein